MPRRVSSLAMMTTTTTVDEESDDNRRTTILIHNPSSDLSTIEKAHGPAQTDSQPGELTINYITIAPVLKHFVLKRGTVRSKNIRRHRARKTVDSVSVWRRRVTTPSQMVPTQVHFVTAHKSDRMSRPVTQFRTNRE